LDANARLVLSLNNQIRIISLLLVISLATAASVCGAQTAAEGNPAASPASDASIREQLIGTWRLVSRESRRENGELEPDPKLSVVPLGVLIYDRSGHVAAQLSRRDRTVETLREECRTAADTKGTSDTAQTVLGYDAYFGTYKINERDGIVTHHLESALWPEDVGKDIERHFKLSGDKLTISFNTSTHDGVKVTRTLTWERQK
jgi:hypothetical protein